MRPLVYFIASTVDGFVAAEDGPFDFLPGAGGHLEHIVGAFPATIPGHLREALGVIGPNRAFDTMIMGRRTWDVGGAAGITSP
jgi:hypothetical protein